MYYDTLLLFTRNMLETVLFLVYFITREVWATNTLSTASSTYDDIVKPTASSTKFSYLSELIVKSVDEQALYNDSNYRKFIIGNDHQKERIAEIWNWDYWCKLQPVVGTCDESIRKFYYDLKTEQCKPISYSGCGGGKNLFDTKKDCEKTCVGANDMLKPSKNFGEQLDCLYQPDPGICLAYLEELFYDVNLESCRTFIYGGCGGNANRFQLAEECLSTCKNSHRRANKRGEPIVY